MTEQSRAGIDIRGDRLFVARVRDNAGRPLVESLGTLETSELATAESLKNTSVTLAAGDRDVIIKMLRLSRTEGYELDRLARFELATSMLEPENTFDFDVIPTGLEDKYLGLVYRKTLLEEQKRSFKADTFRVDRWQARAIGLGRGYLNFCRAESGEFVCLADLGDSTCSVCFAYRRHLVGVAHFEFKECDFSDDDAVRKLAVEAKTVINFKQSSLSSEGITLPLSTLILSGDNVDDRVRGIFKEYFPAGVTSPSINKAYLAENLAGVWSIENFLVALGLTVI